MANASAPSERASHPKGLPDASAPDGLTTNEDRVVAGPNGPERIAGGALPSGVAAFSPNADAGRRTSNTSPHDRDEKPNRQNDAGELANTAG